MSWTTPLTPFEAQRQAWCTQGYPVLANVATDGPLLAWARRTGRFCWIDRSTKWGNPFVLRKGATLAARERVAQQYAHWFVGQLPLHRALADLAGKVLVCHCTPLACHGEVLQTLTRPGAPDKVTASSADDPDPDPAERPGSTADPPAARNGHAPVLNHGVELPPDLAGRYVLGNLCARGHDYEGTGQSVRKRSNGGCKRCQDGQVRKSMPPAHRHGPTPAAPQTRPELPGHLQDTCFLSPITCADPAHRYREHPELTLRFVESELCVQCTTQTHTLAGD